MTTSHPRLLLVEDDPTSLAFLQAALEALPAVVDGARSMAAAIALAQRHRYDLWLIDAHLPDGSGAQLLGHLRAQAGAVPALAHTAATEDAVLHALRMQGFDDVILKPLAAAQLRRHVAWRLALEPRPLDQPAPACPLPAAALPVWDDVAAATALNGNDAHVQALRGLFVAELPGTGAAIAAAMRLRDQPALASQLHRLRASCGFTGAALLAAAARALQAEDATEQTLRTFESAVARTLSEPAAPRVAGESSSARAVASSD